MKLRILALAAAVLFVAGCDDWEWGNFDRYKEDFHYAYDVNPGVHVYLENMNGSVEITGWDRNSIDISGTKHASSEAVLHALRIDVVASGDSVRIRTIPPSGHRGGHGAKYVIRLPEKAILDGIESSNGGIRIEGIAGAARLRTSNGGLKVYRLTGPLDARTSNGGVDVSDVRGTVVVQTSNGGVHVEDVRGPLEASTSNGGMSINLMDPESQQPVKLSSSNGSIELTLGEFRNNDIRLSTSNSSITLRLPGDASGQLKARTSNSSINTDFDLMVKAGQLQKSYVEGTIGTGGPLFDLTTSNGSIKVLKL